MSSVAEINDSLRQDVGGIEMWSDHKDLIERLDYVLGHCESRYMKGDYKELKGVLLEIETGAMKTLIRVPLKLSLFNIYTDSRMWTRTESHSTFNCALPLLCP